MRLWEQKILEDERFKLINTLGVEGAAKELSTTVTGLMNEITLLRYQYDSENFAEERLWIMDKAGMKVPLRYNFGQRKIALAKEKQIKEGKPVRIALLKARQFGGSTLEEGDVFRESILRSGRSSMIIAHDLDSARHLREMSARYYENYDLTKPKLKKETDKWWKFMHIKEGKRHDSNLRIDTAEELSTGHSLTLHHLHLSEIQNWRNATILVRGLFPTVPNSPDTTIFMEGTGSGVGDYWYDFCQMAMSPESEWEFVFVPWYEIEDYTLSFKNEDKRTDFEAKLSDEEKTLYKRGISLEKLYWRQIQIRDTYKGDKDAFMQQYPASPEEAFLTSGRPVFNQTKIKEAMLRSRPPVKVGNLRKIEGIVKFIEDEYGYWELWEEPLKGENRYILGADVAEGIAVIPELGNKGGDYSCAKVLRRDTRKFVGRIHVRLDPDEYARQLELAGLYWNCNLFIENNPGGSGNVVIHDLKNTNVKLLKNVTIDKIHDTVKQEYGWNTDKDSKRQMIDELTELIREERFTDYSKNFWFEASTYVRDEKGRTNAQSRKFDDEVVATAITFQGDKLLPMYFPEEEEKKKEITRDMDIPQNWNKVLTQESVMEENYV